MPGALPWRLNVRDRERIPVVVAEILESLRRIDVLVNNAGIQRDGPESIVELPVTILEQTLDINVHGPLALTQAVVPAMLRQGYGRIEPAHQLVLGDQPQALVVLRQGRVRQLPH